MMENTPMIQKAQIEDLEEIAKIEASSFAHPWSLEDLKQDFEENPFSRFLVLKEDGRIIAYVDLWVIFEQAQISRIAVLPEFRRQKKASELLKAAIDAAREEGVETLTLEVREGNHGARAFYEDAGFTLLHVAKNYYENREDALVMGAGI